MERIFLIDGHAQIFRMYYAFMRRPMINSKGVDTSILFGFTKMLLELIAKEHPTHLAVAFDPPAKTFRHEAFPEYKANRSAAPELVKEALEPLQEILAAFNIPVVMVPGYEADDVIGSMATQWKGFSKAIYMVTPDKDYGQLIDDNVFQYKPGKGGNETEIVGKEEICSHYGICAPEQIIDILTIWGDSSDNVPGVRGIGEVGAKKLVGKYGNLKGILDNIAELPKKQQESIQEAAEQIKMSRFLVTIKTDMELPVTLDDLRMQPLNYTAVYDVFNKFEFNSLRKLLPQNPHPEKTPEYIMANSSAAGEQNGTREEMLPVINQNITIGSVLESAVKNGELAIKITGSNALVLAVSNQNDTSFDSCTIPDLRELGCSNPAAFAELKDVLENPGILKTGYGFKQYINILNRFDIDLNSCSLNGGLKGIGDIEIMHYLLNPERSHKDELLIKSYLGIELSELEQNKNNDNSPEELPEPDLFSTGFEEKMDLQPSRNEINLCALSLPLYRILQKELDQAAQSRLYHEIEMPLIGVLADMERQGVTIDIPHLKGYSKELTSEINEIELQVRELAEEPDLNLSSPKQVGILLYEKLKLNPKAKKSAKGNYSTDEESLSELADKHPIVNKILEFRALKKLLSTYIDNFPALVSPVSGKVHTTFNQTVTATGRLSSANPNLQNIPIRTQRGKEIRKAFIPSDPNGYIVSADYSQIELRLMAHMSGDKDLIAAFNNGKDIHTATAAKIFNVTEEEVTKEQRSRAKTANFGIIYGISAFGLSQRLGMGRSESKQLIEEYFKNYPGVKEYMNNMITKAKEKGYVETIYGRRRFLPDINSRNAAVRSFSERNAINAPLQGSAADIIKVAMIRVYKRLKEENIRSKMVLQVHDELVFDVVPEEQDRIREIVKNEMEKVIQLHVPLIADCNSGKNWLEAH